MKPPTQRGYKRPDQTTGLRTAEEVALALGVSRGTVWKTERKFKAALRKILEGAASTKGPR